MGFQEQKPTACSSTEIETTSSLSLNNFFRRLFTDIRSRDRRMLIMTYAKKRSRFLNITALDPPCQISRLVLKCL